MMKYVFFSPVLVIAVSLLVDSSGADSSSHKNKIERRNLSLYPLCDSSATDNTIIHTGKDLSTLESLAASNPDDGYLSWWTTTQDSATRKSYDNSIYAPTRADPCKGIGFHWTINAAQETIQIAVAVQTNSQDGWAAIGFSETGGMRGADVVYFTSSSKSITDAHILDTLTYPYADNRQDWMLNNYQITGDGYLIFEATRKLDTNDIFDRVFVDDSSIYINDHKFIGSWGSSPNMGYHGSNRVHTSVQLFDSSTNSDSVSSGLDYDNFIEQMTLRSEGSAKLALTRFEIPVQETYYHEKCFSMSDLIDLGFFSDESAIQYIIGYEFLIQSENIKYMHHILVYGHYNGCNSYDRSPIFVWAPGEEFLYFPNEAGMKFDAANGFKAITMQFHIDNRDQDIGKVDTGSGLRLFYTSNPVENEVGMMQVGDPFVRLNGQPVGSGLTRHSFSCPSSCTKKRFVDQEITVVKEGLHMHSFGKRVVNEVHRNGKVIHKSFVDYWDFDQSGNPSQQNAPYQVQKGDEFKTVCYYHDSKAEVRFGIGSQDEMCMTFILYFPKQPMETCGVDYFDSECRTNYLGSTSISSESELGRNFGNVMMSKSPTQSPTEIHSNYPSKYPSNSPSPSKFHPNDSSDHPSISPSKQPSKSPSNSATDSLFIRNKKIYVTITVILCAYVKLL